jgi:hypothetical protein
MENFNSGEVPGLMRALFMFSVEPAAGSVASSFSQEVKRRAVRKRASIAAMLRENLPSRVIFLFIVLEI